MISKLYPRVGERKQLEEEIKKYDSLKLLYPVHVRGNPFKSSYKPHDKNNHKQKSELKNLQQSALAK